MPLTRDLFAIAKFLFQSLWYLEGELGYKSLLTNRTHEHNFMTQGPTLSGSPTILVFRTEWDGNILTGTSPNGGVDCLERMKKITIFDQYLATSRN